jgi:Na+/glutamate symporter
MTPKVNQSRRALRFAVGVTVSAGFAIYLLASGSLTALMIAIPAYALCLVLGVGIDRMLSRISARKPRD